MLLSHLLVFFMLQFSRIQAFRSVARMSLLRPFLGRQFSAGNEEQSVLYIGNLPLDFSLDRLNNLASSRGIAGYTGRLVMQRDKFRGFGYLDFDTPEEAKQALEKLAGAEVDGRKLKVDLDAGTDGPTKGRRPSLFSDENSIFIGNLAFSLNRADIQHMVEEELGKVTMKVRLAVGDNLKSKGYCHVDFTKQEDVDLAIEKLNLLSVRGRELTVARSIPRVRNTHNEEEEEEEGRNNDGVTRFVPRGDSRSSSDGYKRPRDFRRPPSSDRFSEHRDIGYGGRGDNSDRYNRPRDMNYNRRSSARSPHWDGGDGVERSSRFTREYGGEDRGSGRFNKDSRGSDRSSSFSGGDRRTRRSSEDESKFRGRSGERRGRDGEVGRYSRRRSEEDY